MKQNLDERTPVLDMDIPVTLKVRDLIKLNQILSRTYDEEDSLRETLGPILQEIRKAVQEIETDSEWTNLNRWDSGLAVLDKAVGKQKKHLKRIKRALLKHRNLRISYCVPGTDEITKRTIIPLDLWESDSYWLLRAYCYLKGEEYTFRLDRILKLKEKSGSKGRALPVAELLEEDVLSPNDYGYDEELADDSEMESMVYIDEDFAENVDPVVSASEDTIKVNTGTPTGHKSRHYSLPGKKPHQSGLPNRLERLIKRVERKLP